MQINTRRTMPYYYDITLQNDLQEGVAAEEQKSYVQYYSKVMGGTKGPRIDGRFFAWKRSNVVCIRSNFDGLISIPDKDWRATLTIAEVIENETAVTNLVQI
jgi:hypothetical protein